jgi:enoyl-CoA hydratase/carnithine racemase
MSRLIEYERTEDHVATLRINRPEVRNALSWNAMEQFAEAVKTARGDQDLRLLIVSGGPQAFCAGGDLRELHRYPTHEDGVRLAALMGSALQELATLPFPTIAAIEGPAMGGGAEIALACDLRVAAQSVKFGLMHIRLGIATAWGGAPRLAKLVGYSRALEWQTRGVVLTGPELYSLGLANSLVPDGDAFQEALKIALEIASMDPSAVRAIKQTLIMTSQQDPQSGAEYERQIFPTLWTGPAHLQAADRFMSKYEEK